MNLAGEWVDRVHQRKSLKQIILDMDSSVSPTYGNQEGTAYNGYFQCMCYHPLFCFNQYGDLERALLRKGNENAQRQAHQDRSQGGQPFALCDISNGRSGCAEGTLSGNP